MTSLVLDRQDLHDTLVWVGKAIAPRPTQPVLGGVRLSATSAGSLSVAANDYEHSHEGHVDATVARPGHVLVPGHMLRDVVAAMKGDSVALETNEGETQLVVRGGRATMNVPTLPLGEWPRLPALPPVVGKTGSADLSRMVRVTTWARSTDELLPVITGVHLVGTPEGLMAETTNRFCIARLTVGWSCDEPVDILVGGARFAAAAGGLRGVVAIHADQNRLALVTSTRTVTIRRMTGEFPELAGLIGGPDTWETAVEIPAEQLADAFKRIAIVVDRNTTVGIDIDPDAETVTVSGGEGSSSGSEPLAADITGSAIASGFNPAYMAAALEAMESERVVIGLTTARKPAVIRPLDDDGPDALAVVMPRRI